MELKEFKTGAVRIAAEAGVPLVPVILWGTQRMMTKDHPRDFSRGKTIALTVGEPMYPTGDNPAAETAELKARMSALLDADDRRLPRRRAAAGVLVAPPPPRWLGPHARGGQGPRRRGEARARAQAGGEASRSVEVTPSHRHVGVWSCRLTDLSLCRHKAFPQVSGLPPA